MIEKNMITKEQLCILSEQFKSTDLLFTAKEELVNFFNGRLGRDLYKTIYKMSHDLFFAETVDGAPLFLNRFGIPTFNMKDIRFLKNSRLMSAYINTMRFKRGTLRTYTPRIKDVVYIDHDNCMFKVIDISNNVLLVDITTNLSVYNTTTKQKVLDKSTGEQRELGVNCSDFPNFVPDKKLIELSKNLEQNKSEDLNKVNEPGLDTPNVEDKQFHKQKNEEMNDIYQLIINNLYDGISISKTIQDNNLKFGEIRKYMLPQKFEKMFSVQEKFRNMNFINENVITDNVGKKEIIDFIFDVGFFLSFGLSKITTFAVNEDGEKELENIMSKINDKQLIHGMTYFDVIDNINKISQNINMTVSTMNEGNEFLSELYPLIVKYVVDKDKMNRKETWLNRIKDLRQKYLNIMKHIKTH